MTVRSVVLALAMCVASIGWFVAGGVARAVPSLGNDHSARSIDARWVGAAVASYSDDDAVEGEGGVDGDGQGGDDQEDGGHSD